MHEQRYMGEYSQGYGEGYEYAHEYKDKITSMDCLPESLKGKKYYYPTDIGNEKAAKETLKRIEELKKKRKGKDENKI